MQIMKNSSKLFLVILLAAAIGACSLLGEKERVYTGPAVLGFTLPEPTGIITADTTRTFEIQLVRSQEGVLNEPLPVEFTVVDSTTTAPPASYEILTEFNQEGESIIYSTVIPAGELATDIQISFNPAAIEPSKVRELEIYLIGNEQRGITGGENIGYLHLLLEGTGSN